MPLTDIENLESFRTWRDNLLAALKTPESVSAYGGSPDVNGPVQLQRMAARAQLLDELRWVEERITELETTIEGDTAFEVTSEMYAL